MTDDTLLTENAVLVLHLSSGVNVMGRVKSIGPDTVRLYRAVQCDYVPVEPFSQGRMGLMMMPFPLGADQSRDTEISRAEIVAVAKPEEALVQQYHRSTSSLLVPGRSQTPPPVANS